MTRAPSIRISDAAKRAFVDASVDLGEDSLRLAIDPRFAPDLYIGPKQPGDIAVDCDGITLRLDPPSAARANGVSIDYVQGPNATGFKIENPNQPGREREIVLQRDCPATLIPSGEKTRLSLGERVVLTQALGGSFTVRVDAGFLARVAACDADALGFEASQEPVDDRPFELERVVEQLKQVFDPEIPVNVVDLGLIYACEARPIEGGGQRVEIKMSMTAPGCGMGDVLKEDARARVLAVPGVGEVDVEIVWDPPWDKSRMSEAARLQLGMW